MTLQRIAAFAHGPTGGNPAGVWIADTLPDPDEMQAIATAVGYSETAFAAPTEGGFRVRYFAPVGEVPFCGHATIALGAALGAAFGAGRYGLILNTAEISVTASRSDAGWGAELVSPPTRHRQPGRGLLRAAMDLFALPPVALATDLPCVLAHAGADHLILPLALQADVAAMDYDLEAGAALMTGEGLVTIMLAHRSGADRFHVRNAFASGGVHEDPATGAAAAALAGWLRDTGRHCGGLTITQGIEMGCPSRITTRTSPERGSGVRVSGTTRPIKEDG